MTTSTQTNPVNSTPDSWENRIEQAAIFLGLKPEEVEAGLKELGVEKEPAGLEMLSDEEVTLFGDIRKVFGDDKEIPIAKVRMAMKYLRGPKDSPKTDSLSTEAYKMKEKYGVKLKLEHIPTEQLLEDYNPNRSDHPITLVLKKRFGDNPVIAFKPDSTEVDIEATANYITDLDVGYAVEETVESQGELVRLYKVGEVPHQVIEEDPMFEGYPLKRGRSTINRVKWLDVPIEERQFIRILVESNEIDPNDRRDIRDILDIAETDGIAGLKKEFPEAALTWRERKNMDSLPNLVMSMEQATRVNSQNPFGIKNRQY